MLAGAQYFVVIFGRIYEFIYSFHLLFIVILLKKFWKISNIVFVVHLSRHLIYNEFVNSRVYSFTSLTFKILHLIAKCLNLCSEFNQIAVSVIDNFFVLAFPFLCSFEIFNHLIIRRLLVMILHINWKFCIFFIIDYCFLCFFRCFEIGDCLLFDLVVNVMKILNEYPAFHLLIEKVVIMLFQELLEHIYAILLHIFCQLCCLICFWFTVLFICFYLLREFSDTHWLWFTLTDFEKPLSILSFSFYSILK